MVFSAIFIITDGIFVGKGIGSDALAAVNITAPLFLINTGVALMFGIGASVVASIHLSQGKVKVARINITQAVVVSSLLLIAYAAVILCNVEKIALLLGSSPRLLPLATEYMHWFVPFLVFSALLSSGMFFVRLDGSPNYAMVCNIIPALLNIGLDYLFIFVFKWGMFGAALATSLGYIVGALMILIYLMQPHRVLHLCKVKLSSKSLRLTLRNTGYMCKLGLSSFLCEAAIATMMFTGNYVFIHYLGEDGVAAYSIACYFFPIIGIQCHCPVGTAHSQLQLRCRKSGARTGSLSPGPADRHLLRCRGICRYNPVLRSNHLVVYRQFLSGTRPGRQRTSPVCFRLRVLRHQHCIHRLFPECGTRPSGHGHHPAAWFYPHPVLFLADAHPVGSTGNLAGCPRFRTADLSFCHYHLLSQKTKLKIYYLCACINAKRNESFY